MLTEEILRRCEENSSLFDASNEELEQALLAATREIHRYAIQRELEYRKIKWKYFCQKADGLCQYGSGKHRKKHYTIPKKYLK